MPFKKYMLLSYKPEEFLHVLSEEYMCKYVLTVRVVIFWGLCDKIVNKVVKIPWDFDIEKFYKPKLNVWLEN